MEKIIIGDEGLSEVQSFTANVSAEFDKLESLRDQAAEAASDLDYKVKTDPEHVKRILALNLIVLVEAMENKISDLGTEVANLDIAVTRQTARMQQALNNLKGAGMLVDEEGDLIKDPAAPADDKRDMN